MLDRPQSIACPTSADNHLLKLRPLEAEAVRMFFQALSPLRELLDAPDLAEIMINDYRNVWVERRGVMTRENIDLAPANISKARSIRSPSSVEKSAQGRQRQGHHQRRSPEPAYRSRHEPDVDRRPRAQHPEAPRIEAHAVGLREHGGVLGRQRATRVRPKRSTSRKASRTRR